MLSVGDEVDVVITDIDFDKKRVSLSMKELIEKPEETIEALADEADDAPVEDAPVEEAPVEEATVEEAPAEEAAE